MKYSVKKSEDSQMCPHFLVSQSVPKIFSLFTFHYSLNNIHVKKIICYFCYKSHCRSLYRQKQE